MPKLLSRHPIHLGRGATAIPQPQYVPQIQWYVDYGARHADDGVEGRLVVLSTFDGPWSSWEMHPNGAEVVVCTAGELTLIQEIDGEQRRVELRAGEYAINEPGVWHTADVAASATALFITAGVGTQHRPR
jgi:quercetin dioxygenase-like cupin family protein